MNTSKFEIETVLPVNEIPVGTLVRKIQICKTCNGDGCTSSGLCTVCETKGYKALAKVYKRGKYVRGSQLWNTKNGFALDDTDDISREVIVSPKTRLLVGFTY